MLNQILLESIKKSLKEQIYAKPNFSIFENNGNFDTLNHCFIKDLIANEEVIGKFIIPFEHINLINQYHFNAIDSECLELEIIQNIYSKSCKDEENIISSINNIVHHYSFSFISELSQHLNVDLNLFKTTNMLFEEDFDIHSFSTTYVLELDIENQKSYIYFCFNKENFFDLIKIEDLKITVDKQQQELSTLKKNLDIINDINVLVSVRLAQKNISLKELKKIKVDKELIVDKDLNDEVEVMIDGKVVAYGEVVVADNHQIGVIIRKII